MRGLVADRRSGDTDGSVAVSVADGARAERPVDELAVPELLASLAAGTLRAAQPDPEAPDGWRVRPDVKAAILAVFADRTMDSWTVGPFAFHDRANLPPTDQEQMRVRCARYGIKFPDKP